MEGRTHFQEVFGGIPEGRLPGIFRSGHHPRAAHMRWLQHLSWLIVLNGMVLAVLTWLEGWSWPVRSPLLRGVGAPTILIVLVGIRLGGLLWWVVTGSHRVSVWANDLLPWGIQPYRSILGIVGLSLLTARTCYEFGMLGNSSAIRLKVACIILLTALVAGAGALICLFFDFPYRDFLPWWSE